MKIQSVINPAAILVLSAGLIYQCLRCTALQEQERIHRQAITQATEIIQRAIAGWETAARQRDDYRETLNSMLVERTVVQGIHMATNAVNLTNATITWFGASHSTNLPAVNQQKEN